MNDNAKKWVAALRCGKYQQTTGYLARKALEEEAYSYCCLGVACEVYINEGNMIAVYERIQENQNAYKQYGGSVGDLPREVADWLGLQATSGEWANGDLAFCNDTKGLRFTQIADIIEQEPEGLFAE